ncbi:4-diphosphocytidyl-2-C-methyl-D-erythritol kinase [Desulfitobacterium dichloroeliminans LMG P-21439]|uniref:4-diphosphocytidyl-2-C-methyl-D-erythritol kinase n=1 Tax=Desulfitobacterium dichloroeliminans (strain LMG P-21439 / DCA1) TaxID=871963 RepID=L0F1B3_DESDL|nr:4-(cytidine 5'-diphospho)-2-C-methyl-D-erythritol kinase [Desulfitobacterium dichloroeliminans]AGA67624.1 4-diphosphocytidyl-2-C-methyl-D-erythritol kinase [Desulfitobacterium dichloroeliminans LMG P-21439]
MSQNQVELFAYAKINLALAVTGRRSDGYHELESVMQSIGLSDRIRITLTERGIECSCGEWSGPENLAYQAARVFLAGLNTTSGIKIEIEKNIPVQAGLGGGSADAAATLYALNHLFQEPYSLEQLKSLAAGLGADVAFCLQGGTQWATGVGDVLKDLPLAPRIHLVIVKPWQGVNTALAYRTFDQESKFTHLSYEEWRKALALKQAEALAPLLYNDMEPASMKLLPEIARIKEDLQKEEGCLGALMSGSGSAVFGMFQSSEQAQRVVGSWQDKECKVWVTHTVERGHCHG